MLLKTDRLYLFPFGPDELWERISQVAEFPRWWPWLRRFEGDGLRTGDVWKCRVRPPVPYSVRFTVTIDEVLTERSVTARISGDIIGTASLGIEAEASGCRVRLVADLAPEKKPLRALSIAARPVVRFGHNWVLNTGARQFLKRSHPPPRGARQNA